MRPPEKETPAGGAGVGGSVINQDRGAIVDDSEALRKLRDTLAARLALQGVELHELAGGGFVAIGVGTYARLGDLGAVKRYVMAREGRA
jgi:hypothetical protein